MIIILAVLWTVVGGSVFLKEYDTKRYIGLDGKYIALVENKDLRLNLHIKKSSEDQMSVMLTWGGMEIYISEKTSSRKKHYLSKKPLGAAHRAKAQKFYIMMVGINRYLIRHNNNCLGKDRGKNRIVSVKCSKNSDLLYLEIIPNEKIIDYGSISFIDPRPFPSRMLVIKTSIDRDMDNLHLR